MKLQPTQTVKSRASILIEVTLAFSAITILAMLLLKSSANATTSQQWTVVQGVTDAFMTRELAIAQRTPFDDFKANGSDWPVYPTVTTSTVEIAKLPGGIPLTGTLKRTRVADSGNRTYHGGTANSSANPLEMEAWKLQSFLVYKVGQKDYVKSRTTLRVR